MLQVVIDRVASVVPGELPVEQSLEIAKGALDSIEGIVRPKLPKQIAYRAAYGFRRTDLHGVRNIEIAAPVLHVV
jgi:hypothetical protein